MDFQKDIMAILQQAVHAPSGDNSQPWQFSVSNRTLAIIMQPEKDNPIFNYRGRGTLAAHGALLQNILIVSPHFGYEAHMLEILPADTKNVTARILFEPIASYDHELYPYVTKRVTNRKSYTERQLTPEQKDAFTRCAADFPNLTLTFAEQKQDRDVLGQAMGVNETVMLENQGLHDLFFSDVRWTEAEENKYKTGLYLPTMELDLPKRTAFRILQYWPAAQFLNRFGMARFIAKENGKVYASAAAIGAIIVEDRDEDFLTAGRLMQNIWLTATKLNLSMHLVTGIIFLAQQIFHHNAKTLSVEHTELVKAAYADMERIFAAQQKIIGVTFRLGEGGQSSGASSRLVPNIQFS